MCESSCTDCAEVCQHRKGGRWSRKETDFLLKSRNFGEHFRNIGTLLGRSENACEIKYRSVREDRTA